MKERIIIALDVAKLENAVKLVDQLPDADIFKVGLQAFLKFGNDIITYLQQNKKKVFLDLKFKDIPNTVHGAIKSSLKYSPNFLTIHLSGGADMIQNAAEAAKDNPDLTLLGVTILTSLSNNDLFETGINLPTDLAVLKLCELGLKNGVSSFVCSPQEIESIKEKFGKDITLVTPGIRPLWSVSDDQKRVFTPRMAVEKGADYLVIGRPITKNENPSEGFKKILAEISI